MMKLKTLVKDNVTVKEEKKRTIFWLNWALSKFESVKIYWLSVKFDWFNS